MDFEVIEIKEVGEGLRVSVDFVDLLNEDEGLYVGNTCAGYVKILSESRKTENYNPRPFRVNCGAIHQYLFSDGETIYLSEIESGMMLTVYGADSERKISVGRVKIERRNLKRFVLKNENDIISITIQDVETLYLDGSSTPILAKEIKIGDKIKCLKDDLGRHKGVKIEEFICEK